MSENSGDPQLLMRLSRLGSLPAAPPCPIGYRLRAARHTDDGLIARLMTQAFGNPWSEDRVRANLTDAPDVKACYVVTHGAAVVATASARFDPDRFPGAGYVHWVGSHPAHCGRKLGTIVTMAVLDHFRAAGCTEAILETDDWRLPAIACYLGMGFCPVETDARAKQRWDAVRTSLAARVTQ